MKRLGDMGVRPPVKRQRGPVSFAAQILLFSLRAALRFPLRTLGLAALWAALGAAFRFFPPALILAPGLGTFAATFLLEPAFRHYMPERSEFDEGTDTWYLE